MILFGAQKIKRVMRMWIVKARLMRFQIGMRALLEMTRDCGNFILANNFSVFWPCPKTLCVAELKVQES